MTPVTPKDPVAAEGACVDPAEEPRRRGRPLSADRTPAILKATIDLVDEVGYDHLRIQDVADRAGVGLATIYRRWPTKQALFIDALRAKQLDLPDTGDVRADLLAIFERMAEALEGGFGQQLLPGCLAVARDEPEIAQALRDTAMCGMRDHLRMLIAREVGDDDPELELRVDLGPGVLLQRAMLYGEKVCILKTLDSLVDVVLRPRSAG
jgi:AcrR family transcriptional regulator